MQTLDPASSDNLFRPLLMSNLGNPLPAESQPTSQLYPSAEQKDGGSDPLLAENWPKSEGLQPASPDLAGEMTANNGTVDALEKSPELDLGNSYGVHGGFQETALAELEQAVETLEETGFFPVLRNRNFLTLWGGQVFSQLADKVYLVLMISLIASRFQAEGQTISGWVSSIMIAFTIPAVLFSSLAGVFVDRWSKKVVLVITNLLRGGLVLFLPPLLWISKGWTPLANLPVGFWVLLTVTFLVSTLTQFFAPAEQAAIPLIVERRNLLSANSLYTTTMMASVIVGFAVGEPLLALADHLVAHFGLTAVGLGKELVVGGAYTIAGLVLLLLRTPESLWMGFKKQPKSEGEPEKHVMEDIREGWQYLNQQKRVRSALIQLIVLFSVFAALSVLAVRLAEVIPDIKSSQFGFLLSAGGVGIAIGATFLGQFGQRFSHTQLSLVGSIGMGASLLGLSVFTERLVPALILILLMGVFGALIGVPMQTAIQEETPEEMRGKIFGLQNTAVNIALSLPLALAGVAETFLGLRIVFLGLAAIVVAGGLITWYVSRTDLVAS